MEPKSNNRLISRALANAFATTATFFASLWCTLSLHFNSLLPSWSGTLLAVVFVAMTVFAWRQSQSWRAFLKVFLPAALAIGILWCFVLPSHEPAASDGWSRLHAKMPIASFDGDTVSIQHVRNSSFQPNGEYEVRHEDRTFQLSDIESVWFGEQHFANFRGIAHTFVSFGFRNGEYLSISAEARRGEGENFSPVRGFFKQFGLIYVVSAEQDAIRRSLGDDLPIYLYPIRASDEQMQAMFQHMLLRANRLHKQPEFYHTARNNCASNIVDSFNEIAPIHFSRYSPFIVLPGYSGKVAFKQGLIDTETSFEEIQQQARINELALEATEESFSQHIRSKVKQHERQQSANDTPSR